MLKMTYQDFNYLFCKFTNSKKGIGYSEKISVSGIELKEFIDFAMAEFSTNELLIESNKLSVKLFNDLTSSKLDKV